MNKFSSGTEVENNVTEFENKYLFSNAKEVKILPDCDYWNGFKKENND